MSKLFKGAKYLGNTKRDLDDIKPKAKLNKPRRPPPAMTKRFYVAGLTQAFR